MPKLRLRITVPRPESTINLGNPDLAGHFGWEGISLKSDRHFYATINDDSVFQSGGSSLFQTEEKWHQFADEMALGTEKRLYFTSGEAMVLFSGGGQGSHDEAELGEGAAPPITNTYNRIDLMAEVQKQAVHARTFLGGIAGEGADARMASGFIKRAAQLDVDLGHIRDVPSGNEMEQRRVTPDPERPPPPNPIARALETLTRSVNRAVGIEMDHDMMARFNPYSGVKGLFEFFTDLLAKLRNLIASENVGVKSAKSITDAVKSLQKWRDRWEAVAQDFSADSSGNWRLADEWAQDAAEQYDEPPAAELGQATLIASPPPWRLDGDGPWAIEAKVDGAADFTPAGSISATRAQLPTRSWAPGSRFTGTLVFTVDGQTTTTVNLRNADGGAVLSAIQGAVGGAGGRASQTSGGAIPTSILVEGRKHGTRAAISVVDTTLQVDDPNGGSIFVVTSGTGGGDVADTEAVTLEDVRDHVTMPSNSERSAFQATDVSPGGTSAEETLRFRSLRVGKGSRIALRGPLAQALGVEAEDAVEGGEDDDDFARGVDDVDKAPKLLESAARTLTEPFDRIGALANESEEVVEDFVEIADTIAGAIMKNREPPGPLALFAKSGISLGTEDRVYGSASRGFYFVADGKQGDLVSDKTVPRILKAVDDLDTAINRKKEGPALSSLGFVVRSDSDVDLKADYSVSLAAVGDQALARIASAGVTDITAKHNVAIGPRGDDGVMEVFGNDILVGTADASSIVIKTKYYPRVPAPPAEGEPPEGPVQPRMAPVLDATAKSGQVTTQRIALSAESWVRITVGNSVVEVNSDGIKITGSNIQIGDESSTIKIAGRTATWNPQTLALTAAK